MTRRQEPRPSPVRLCPGALADLAAALRPDWHRAAIDGAITGCVTAGWPWPRVVVGMVRTALDPDGQPYDLPRTVIRLGPPDLLHRPPQPADPAARDRYLQEMRDQLPPTEGQQMLPIVAPDETRARPP
ncbi:hypothetical protein [Streptomonospora litoralis]|uniref:Uncharacterized protein n=1 Tax=Streptomonospora litoralis TaxID=2498135 RepID=A0A4P6Q3S6_9ACTN|nr:hypothetical protein [Streptomonospora litoralis]QBI53474.1 hypothetical protein EKD16_08400 [Streptomonospora litoralis]